MKKNCLMLLLLCTISIGVQAQNDSTRIAIEQINKIKLDAEHYLYAEVTMPDWLEAYNAAKSLLKEQMSSWLVNNKGADATSFVAASDEHIFEIKALRGNRYRAFVYIKKSDILAFKDERQLLTVTSDELRDKSAEETLFSMPDSATHTTTSTPVQGSTPASVNASSQGSSQSTVPAASPAGIEIDMLTVHSFNDIEQFVTEHQAKGDISVFGKYASRPVAGIYYMFVYNRNAEIPAYLRYDNGLIINLKTGDIDSMAAYKDCGAIWFRVGSVN